MKIRFLGTGHGVPTATRSCSSTLIESGGAIYYVDGGAPIVDRTLQSGRALTDARAFFITHTHGDHVNGIFHFTDLINWRYTDAKIEILKTTRLEDAKHRGAYALRGNTRNRS